jgi:hypothetical protein
MTNQAATPALRKVADKAIELCAEIQYLQIEWEDEKYGARCEATAAAMKRTWARLIPLVDRVVYAAGGHREGTTWHLCGATLNAQDLYDQEDVEGLPPIHEGMDNTNLEPFLFDRYGRSEADFQALWSKHDSVPPALPNIAMPGVEWIDRVVSQAIHQREHEALSQELDDAFEGRG